MTLDAQFLDWMTATIGLQNVTGLSTDGYGSRTYGSVLSVNARIEQNLQIVKSHDGKEVMSKATIYCPPYDATTGQTAITIGPSDRIMLPSGYDPLITSSSAYLPPIINVERHNDDTTSMMYWMIYI